MVEVMSGGRMEMTYYAVAELMPTEQLTDAIINGLVEWYHSYGPYFSGKMGQICDIESGACNQMPMEGQWNVLNEGGLLEILRTAYAEQNLYYMAAIGLYPIGGDYLYSRFPIENAAALKGMKLRSAGVSAKILTNIGASTTYFPWEELYLALQTGAVDACEMASMSEMFDLGLAEVAQHWYVPPWISSGFCNYLANMDAWNALPEDIQAMMDAAAWAVDVRHGAEPWLLDYSMIPTFEAAGVTIHSWSDKDMNTFLTGWKDVMVEMGASGDPYCAEAFEAIKSMRMQLKWWPE